jgi:hypothetical protein
MSPPTKKSKAPRPDFADAYKACRTTTEREQLGLVLKAGWTSAELSEYARLYFPRNGRDYATPTSYRRAIADVAGGSKWRHANEEPSCDRPFTWLKLFREGGSKILPPRREGLLQRGRGHIFRVDSEEYAWPGHTEEFRSMIEQRTRDYFDIPPDQPVHVNSWAASQRAYWRELANDKKEATKKAQTPKSHKKPRKPAGRKFAP